MWRDDLDTAFRHLDLYDRFGCPGGHVQATFRCLVRFFSAIDPKVPESLSGRVHACWINPAAQPQAAAGRTTPPPPSGTPPPAPAAGARPPPRPRPPPPPPPPPATSGPSAPAPAAAAPAAAAPPPPAK